MNRVFFELEGGREAYNGDVLIFDTTFKTNMYDMKLALYSTVSPQGSTVLLAAAYLMNETTDDFDFCFEEFEKAYGSMVDALFTDSDCAMKVFAAKYPNTACESHRRERDFII